MTQKLDDFFQSKGIHKQVPEFNSLQLIQIQLVNKEVVKPTFEEISEELSSYTNCKGEVLISKKEIHSKENIELRFYRISQNKFIYRISLSLKNDEIIAQGQYSIPNLYGEAINFTDTDLVRPLEALDASAISKDFMDVFIANVNLKR